MNYEKMPLTELFLLCKEREELALAEWKRRWEADFPSMGGNNFGEVNAMSLEAMLQTQENLDNRIIQEREINWTEKERFRNTLVALDVELSEFANEARWFKVWSDRQTPSVEQEQCDYCGEDVDYTRPSPFMGSQGSMCKHCWNMTKDEYAAASDEHIPIFEDYPHFKQKTPDKLLEEFVDAVHFFLSIANQKGWGEFLYIHEEAIEDVREDDFDGGLNGAFLEIKRHLAIVGVEKDKEDYITTLGWSKHEFHFRSAWFVFLSIGMVQYGFTFEQVEEAYYKKNNLNHERQNVGY